MAPPRLMSEDESSFKMHDGNSEFSVPKKDLSPAMVAKVRAMPKMTITMGEPEDVTNGDISFGTPREIPTNDSPNPERFSNADWDRAAQIQTDEIRASNSARRSFGNISVPPQAQKDYLAAQSNLNRLDAPGADPAKASLDTGYSESIPSPRMMGQGSLPPGVRPADSEAPPGNKTVSPPPPPPNVARAKPMPAQSLPGMASERGGIEMEKGANIMSANAKAEEGRQIADSLSATQRQLEANALEDKARTDAANTRVAETMAQFKAAQNDMKNIDTTVDPGRFWASRSTGGKIAGIIGLALGALGSGPDGVNRAATMLNQAIDRDLDAQKSEHTLRLQKGQQSVNAAQSAYAMEHQRFGDESAASAAAKANLLGLAQNKLAQITAASSSPLAAAQAQALNGVLEQNKGHNEQKAANDAATRAHAYAAAAAAREKSVPKGMAGLAAAEQGKVFDVKSASQNIRNNLVIAKDIITKKGTFELTGTEQAELSRALSDVAQDSARLKDPGSTVREAELANAKKAIGVGGGEIFGLRNDTALKLLESYENSIDQRELEALKVRGLTPDGKAK